MPGLDVDAVTGQYDHWESTYALNPGMYGNFASEAALAASARFGEVEASSLLELGAGQGRDTFHFARRGFDVTAVDFSETGLEAIRRRAANSGAMVRSVQHNVRDRLPFIDGRFDACYSHMLFCMALTTSELVSLVGEVRRVLRHHGLVAYTARTTSDAHFGVGTDRGDDMFENGGFIVHFFSPELILQLSEGFEIIDRFEFTEGELPRRLVSVTMRSI